MPWYDYLAHFPSGAFLANGVLHFVQGIGASNFRRVRAAARRRRIVGTGQRDLGLVQLPDRRRAAAHLSFAAAAASVVATTMVGVLAMAIYLSHHLSGAP